MRRTVFVGLIFMLMAVGLIADEVVVNSAFRKSNWGMTTELVKASEMTPAMYETTSLLGYDDSLLGFPVKVYYIFAKSLLVRSKYMFKNKHSNMTDFISDFRTVKKALQDKYGKPLSDEQYWKDDLYKSEPKEWGMAIAVGHLIYYASWEVGDTSILLYLVGENFETKFGIEYSSKSLSMLEEQEKSEAVSGKL